MLLIFPLKVVHCAIFFNNICKSFVEERLAGTFDSINKEKIGKNPTHLTLNVVTRYLPFRKHWHRALETESRTAEVPLCCNSI